MCCRQLRSAITPPQEHGSLLVEKTIAIRYTVNRLSNIKEIYRPIILRRGITIKTDTAISTKGIAQERTNAALFNSGNLAKEP